MVLVSLSPLVTVHPLTDAIARNAASRSSWCHSGYRSVTRRTRSTSIIGATLLAMILARNALPSSWIPSIRSPGAHLQVSGALSARLDLVDVATRRNGKLW